MSRSMHPSGVTQDQGWKGSRRETVSTSRGRKVRATELAILLKEVLSKNLSRLRWPSLWTGDEQQ